MPRRRRQIPRRLAQKYFRDIKALIEEDRSRIWEAFKEEIRPKIHEYRRMRNNKQMHVNADLIANDALEDIDKILRRLRRRAEEETFNERKLRSIARTFAEEINDTQRRMFVDQVTRILPFDPTRHEPWLESFMQTAIEDNVSFIKSIAEEYHGRIESAVREGVRRGISINDIGKEIAHQGDVGLSKGRFIARDQLGTLHGDLTKARQERLGLEKFVWVTADDERVRDSHDELHDQVFTWKDGARNERGEQIWPGTDYNCRCIAEPYDEELEKIKEERAA